MAKNELTKIVKPSESLAYSFDAEGVNGLKLVEISLEQLQREYGQRLVAFISGTMKQVQTLHEQIAQAQHHLQFQLDRLDAIKNNEFTVSPSGIIRFNAAVLNDGL